MPSLIPLLTALAPALAGLFGGIGSAKAAGETTRESRRQYDIERGDKEARSRMTGPMRDRLMYMLMQRFQMPTRELKPPDWFGNSSLGGYDMDEFNRRNAQYQPGMGGGL